MKAKKICCFCECWESGGIESFLNNILLHMDLDALEVDIVAAELKDSVFTAGLRARGVNFIPLSGKLRSLKNHSLFRKLLREKKYDVIHFNLYQGLALWYVHIAKQEGIPVRIAHSHNTALRKSSTRWLKLLLHRVSSRLFAGDATDFWACSGAAANFLFPKKLLARKGFRFIPNGIDTARFAFNAAVREDVRQQLGLTDAFVVGNVGRLCYQKNQDFLLDVFATLCRYRPESRLLLVGEGSDKAALQDKAARLGIAQQIIFYGTSDHVEQLMWAMDVFAFPSRFEGLPFAAVEAQAAGLNILCADSIPKEIGLTSRCQSLPLTADAEIWVGAVLQAAEHKEPRDVGAHEVRAAGFDLADVAQLIRTKYLE